MKKTTLTLALATALFTTMTLLNCSKKEDPAPAATTTTSGTTTSGTTTSGTTSGSTTSSSMEMNKWKVDSDLYTVETSSMKVEKDKDLRTFTFTFGGTNGVFIVFKGAETLPASGIYKLVSTSPKAANEVSMMAPGFSGYFSKSALNSNILVTNTAGVITIDAVNVKTSDFMSGDVIVNGKLTTSSGKPAETASSLALHTWTVSQNGLTATYKTSPSQSVGGVVYDNTIQYVFSVNSTGDNLVFTFKGTVAPPSGKYAVENEVTSRSYDKAVAFRSTKGAGDLISLSRFNASITVTNNLGVIVIDVNDIQCGLADNIEYCKFSAKLQK